MIVNDILPSKNPRREAITTSLSPTDQALAKVLSLSFFLSLSPAYLPTHTYIHTLTCTSAHAHLTHARTQAITHATHTHATLTHSLVLATFSLFRMLHSASFAPRSSGSFCRRATWTECDPRCTPLLTREDVCCDSLCDDCNGRRHQLCEWYEEERRKKKGGSKEGFEHVEKRGGAHDRPC